MNNKYIFQLSIVIFWVAAWGLNSCASGSSVDRDVDDTNKPIVEDKTTDFDDQFAEHERDMPILNNIQATQTRATGIIAVEPSGADFILKFKAVSRNQALARFTFKKEMIHVEQDDKKYACKDLSDDMIMLIKDVPATWSFTIEGGWDPKRPFRLIESGDCGNGCLEYNDVLVQEAKKTEEP